MHDNNNDNSEIILARCLSFPSFKQLHVPLGKQVFVVYLRQRNRRIYALAKAHSPPPPPRDGKDGNPYAIFGFWLWVLSGAGIIFIFLRKRFKAVRNLSHSR